MSCDFLKFIEEIKLDVKSYNSCQTPKLGPGRCIYQRLEQVQLCFHHGPFAFQED